MKTSTALATGSQTDIKGDPIGSYDSSFPNVDVNIDASLVPIEQQTDDLELHLTNQELRAGQDCKFPIDEAIDGGTSYSRLTTRVSDLDCSFGNCVHSSCTRGILDLLSRAVW